MRAFHGLGTHFRLGRGAGTQGGQNPAEVCAGWKQNHHHDNSPALESGVPHVPQRAAPGRGAGAYNTRSSADSIFADHRADPDPVEHELRSGAPNRGVSLFVCCGDWGVRRFAPLDPPHRRPSGETSRGSEF